MKASKLPSFRASKLPSFQREVAITDFQGHGMILMVVRTFLRLAVLLSFAGCATPGGDDTEPGEGGSGDGSSSTDAFKGCPTGRAGADCKSCTAGFHACGSDCVQDKANSPEAGCAKSCGQGCTTPTNASAKCTPEGACDFVCDQSFDKTDGGCECPMGQVACMNGCQQCCQNTDCAPHVVCNGGSCGGCEPGWGDCNQNMADGCETHLNSNGNCGSCGNSCCSSICGCGFLGLGGKSCKPSGQSFSCQC